VAADMEKMTTHERVTRMFERREADRIPITDGPWQGTISRWIREGMPKDADWRDFFGVDKFAMFQVDVSPQYENRVIEDNDAFTVSETSYGVTLKYLKGEDTTPEYLDFKINSPAKWAEAKKRMIPGPDRVDWAGLENSFPLWRSEGRWVQAVFWFGFDVAHSWIVGTETLLVAMLEDPDWVFDIYNTMVDANIALYDMIWDKGYKFDSLFMYDDMGYKNTQFFSRDIYRKLLMPAHAKAFKWAGERGIHRHLHACGNINAFVPDLLDIGLDALNPLEVKAGMDPLDLKRAYGDKLLLHGGIDCLLWDKKDEFIAEVDRIVPVLKENGGYIFSSDHSVPNSVSLTAFREIVDHVKKVGSY
jgi:uroporphyrinogen decarboxylase